MGRRKKQLQIEWFPNHYQVPCVGSRVVRTIHLTNDDKGPFLELECRRSRAESQLKLVQIAQMYETLMWRVFGR